MRLLRVYDAGVVPYQVGLQAQKVLEKTVLEGAHDCLMLLEHPPVITLGRDGGEDHLLVPRDAIRGRGVEVLETDRGGNVTYHGPGQLVGYPIANLDFGPCRKDLHKYVRCLEEVLIRVASDFGVPAYRREGYTGIWVGEKKLASIGIRVRKWVTTHGFALNVNCDLSPFSLIDPCGLKGCIMVNLSEAAGREVSVADVKEKVLAHFARVFRYEGVQRYSLECRHGSNRLSSGAALEDGCRPPSAAGDNRATSEVAPPPRSCREPAGPQREKRAGPGREDAAGRGESVSPLPSHATLAVESLPRADCSDPVFLLPPKKVRVSPRVSEVHDLIASLGIHTVCQEASCPNIYECFGNGVATFLILGNTCTRRCAFCGVGKGRPGRLDLREPERVAEAVKKLRLRHVVITSVTRDDLPDGGASVFARCVEVIRATAVGPEPVIELLVPDFRGEPEPLALVLRAGPDILGHNVETVPRLYPTVRPGASYRRSLDLLALAKKVAGGSGFCRLLTKSGLMLGLGETREEVLDVLRDLRSVGCDSVTIGQYLAPSASHHPVVRVVPDAEFREYQDIALRLGFTEAKCGRFVRSSYEAHWPS